MSATAKKDVRDASTSTSEDRNAESSRRASNLRFYEKLKSDPERLAVMKERHRITARAYMEKRLQDPAAREAHNERTRQYKARKREEKLLGQKNESQTS
jgi:hypothetical protein